MSSVHHVHAALNKLLNDAERTGLVTRNVARLASAPSLTTARARAPEMTVWTPGELSRFLESIDGNRNAAMFRLLALTGMRRGELVALRWSDLDLARSTMTVNQAVDRGGRRRSGQRPEDPPQPPRRRPRPRHGRDAAAPPQPPARAAPRARRHRDGERPRVHRRPRRAAAPELRRPGVPPARAVGRRAR